MEDNINTFPESENDQLSEKDHPLTESQQNTLEWALSFLHWYEKKYQKKHYLHPMWEENTSDEH